METDDEVDNKTETTELSGGEEEKEEEDADPSQVRDGEQRVNRLGTEG